MVRNANAFLAAEVHVVGRRRHGPAEMQAGFALLVELQLHDACAGEEMGAVENRADQAADFEHAVLRLDVLCDVPFSDGIGPVSATT